MPFDKKFFSNIPTLQALVKESTGCEELDLHVRVANETYRVWGLAVRDARYLAISYYDDDKTVTTEKGEARPYLLAPFEMVQMVEFSPIKSSKKRAGFESDNA